MKKKACFKKVYKSFSINVALLILINCFNSQLFAQKIGFEENRIAVENFARQNYQTRYAFPHLRKGKGPFEDRIPEVVDVIPLTNDEGDDLILGFLNVMDNGAIVITSSNKRITPIVMFSRLTSNNQYDFVDDPIIELIKMDLSLRHKNLPEVNPENDRENQVLWDTFLNNNSNSRITSEEIIQWPNASTFTGGWLETTWHQGSPYNDLIPIYPGTGNRSVTGCVATAIAQILNYHQYLGSAVFESDEKYISGRGGPYPIRIDDDHLTYDFPSFSNLNQFLNAVSTKYASGIPLEDHDVSVLNLASAISVKANFSSYSTSASTNRVEEALVDIFGYESADQMTPDDPLFHKTLETNMQDGLPGILSITGEEVAGHAIVVDGYRTDGFYHLNFGWGSGAPDAIAEAWYSIPEGLPAKYSFIRSAILNIRTKKDSIRVSPRHLELLPSAQLSTNSFSLKSEIDTKITSISSSEILVSLDSSVFQKQFFDVTISALKDNKIWVRYIPSDSMITGYVHLEFENGREKVVTVQGYQDGNVITQESIGTAWDDTSKPYLVLEELEIDQGSKLRIDGGVSVYFMGGASLTAKDGTIQAIGTPDEPIVFTAMDKIKGWKGIRLINSDDDDVFNHCQFMHAKKVIGGTAYQRYELKEAVGGALYSEESSPSIYNCLFSNNEACVLWAGTPSWPNGGGAIALIRSSAQIVNCVMVNNQALSWWTYGGALYMEESSVNIVNSTFSKNTSDIGGAIYSVASNIAVENSIFWDNKGHGYPSIPWSMHSELAIDEYSKDNSKWSNSILKDNFFSKGVMEVDPRFRFPAPEYGISSKGYDFDWSLSPNSPGINNGLNGALPHEVSTDIYGSQRITWGVVDLGAFENTDELNYLTASPIDMIDMGIVELGTTVAKNFHLINRSSRIITVDDYYFYGASESNDFEVRNSNNDYQLHAGDTLVIEIAYSPTEIGKDSAVLFVATNSANMGNFQIPVEGSSYKGALISGPVSGVWSKTEGTYNVVGDIWIEEDARLQIKPGVNVLFHGNYSLEVGLGASLEAIGVADDSIKFEALGAWKGIHFHQSKSDDIISYCQLSGVKDYGAINIMDSHPTLKNSKITNNHSAIDISNGGGMFINNSFLNNNGPVLRAVSLDYEMENRAKILFSGNLVKGNKSPGHGIMSIRLVRFVISNNLFTQNESLYGPIDCQSNREGRGYILNNIIANNSSTNYLAISVSNSATIKNNVIANNYGFCPTGSNIICFCNPGESYISNNTIVNNQHNAPAIHANNRNRVVFMNNILRGNSNQNFVDYNSEDLFVSISYSNMEIDTISGDHSNINHDPFFINPSDGIGINYDGVGANWQLHSNSPCIDAGNSEAIYNDIENKHSLGNALPPAHGTVRNDMGAFGGGRHEIPHVSNIADMEIESGSYFNVLVKAEDLDSEVMFFGVRSKPDWISIVDNFDGTATLSGLPGADNIGLNYVTVTVTDGFSDVPSEVSFVVEVTNTAPEFVTDPITNAHPTSMYECEIKAFDKNLDKLEYSLTKAPPWLDIKINEDGSVFLQGIPEKEDLGECDVVITVTDNIISDPIKMEFKIAIKNDAPEFTSVATIAAHPYNEYNYEIISADNDKDQVEIYGIKIPKWLSLKDFKNGTAVLSGVPEPEDLGEVEVKIALTDHIIEESVVQEFQINVDNEKPQFTSEPSAHAHPFKEYEYQISASDNDHDELEILAAKLPKWLILKDLNNGTAVLKGTPQPSDLGVAQIEITVSDNIIKSPVAQGFEVFVENKQPIFTSSPDTIAVINRLYSYNISVKDDDDDSLKVSIINLPQWLNFSVLGNGSAVLEGIPSANDMGRFTVKISADDYIIKEPIIQGFQLRIEEVTGLDADITGSRLFPNPTADIICLQLSEYFLAEKDRLDIKILNLTGDEQIITSHKAIGDNKLEIDLSHLPSGVYILVVYGRTSSFYSKINRL